ncbi:hypothetical protein MBLNU230_g6475t1 [Neophaeotheca triangularis]
MALHATNIERARSSRQSSPHLATFKFPDFSQEQSQIHAEDSSAILDGISRGPSPKPLPSGLPQGLHSSQRWPARKSWRWGSRSETAPSTRHGRQKSLGEAIHTIRARKASVSENAHEIAASLRAPVSLRLLILCTVWYSTSILSNASSKAILTAFRNPVTLTIVQFALVSSLCVILSHAAKHNATLRSWAPVLKNGIRKPNRDLISATLPLTAFQIGGHITNSYAMESIPVSLVHTIKGLSPLMTVFAYRFFLAIRYSIPTYLSLIPLTLGVIMACSADFRGNVLGLTYAFGSAILFVTQNIVSKKIFNEAARAEADNTVPLRLRKPDKLNLLCYSSALALLFTFPIWLWSEGWALITDFLADASIELPNHNSPNSLDHGRLALEFLFNGVFHFLQSLVAFVLLGMVSPVTYSVASLIKRVVVILFAIVWFGVPMTRIQGLGIALTFLGLYLYDRTHDKEKADTRAQHLGETATPLLPLNTALNNPPSYPSTPSADASTKKADPPLHTASPQHYFNSNHHNAPSAFHPSGTSGYLSADSISTNGGFRGGSPRGSAASSPGASLRLQAGTRAEETWQGWDGKAGAIGSGGGMSR